MIELYSYNGQYPSVLPESIRMPNGLTRTDSTTFTNEEILLAGYIRVHNPPVYNDQTENISWELDHWKISPKSLEELTIIISNKWHQIRSDRNILLMQSDWLIIKSLESGSIVRSDILEYRKLLRDITLQTDPYSIEWPLKPAELL